MTCCCAVEVTSKFQSVLLLLQGFKLSPKFSGLQANVRKSVACCSGIPKMEIERVLHMSGFMRGYFFSKYLAFPVFSKKNFSGGL